MKKVFQWFQSILIVSPEDGVAYTKTCRELYETIYIVFLVYKLVKK
jgi:hypothetical protein